MHENSEKALVGRFPAFFRDHGGDPRQTCMAFGLECGDGWYDLIYDACLKLEEALKSRPDVEVVFTQIKEKFGLLRLYEYGCPLDLRDILDDAERASATVCERCGAPGALGATGRWLSTRCPACAGDGWEPIERVMEGGAE